VVRPLDLTDPSPLPGREPEKVLLLLEVVPEDADHWGVLESLRGTTWEAGVKEITAESLSHALHGRFLPLLRELGRDPRASARRVADVEGVCKIGKGCLTWDEGLCRPGGSKGKGRRLKHGPPECYEPPLSDNAPMEAVEVFQRVVFAWREGRYVVVVRGDGFNVA
jgi:hypothetical protein